MFCCACGARWAQPRDDKQKVRFCVSCGSKFNVDHAPEANGAIRSENVDDALVPISDGVPATSAPVHKIVRPSTPDRSVAVLRTSIAVQVGGADIHASAALKWATEAVVAQHALLELQYVVTASRMLHDAEGRLMRSAWNNIQLTLRSISMQL